MRHILSVTLVSVVLCLSPVICCAAEAEQPDPYENTCVLVEAFVVEVQNAALAEAGVNPIGLAPESVTPLKILWCLKDDEKAQVLSGAKLTSRHRNEASSESNGTVHIRRETGVATVRDGKTIPSSNVSYEPYNSRQKFLVRPTVLSEQKVHCGFNYVETSLRQTEDKQMSPPDQLSYNWSGFIVVPSGSPVIAAAVQGESTTTFFILTATVQAGSEEQIEGQ